MNDKKNYAVFAINNEIDMVKKNLDRFGLEVVKTEPMSWIYATMFGIVPTEMTAKEMYEKVSVLIVNGTETAFKDYCTNPKSDVADYVLR